MSPYPKTQAITAGGQERAELGSPTTDLSNAERFANEHGTYVRHHHQSGWYVYDSGIWKRDEAMAANLAQQTVRSIYREAADAVDQKERRMLAAWAQKSESASHISAMLQLARAHDLLRVDPTIFDSDPWLLNVANGIVDLRTGSLRGPQPLDYMTKQAPTTYKQDATHPMWSRFLETMLPDQDVRDFVQLAAGYSLTGDTSAEVLFFVHGPTSSGKSTFVNALKDALGDYSTTTNFETFLRRRDADSRSDMAALWGSRLVVSLEVDRGRAFASALVKNITGMDTIKARFLYHEAFEYRPQFKLWLVANDRPRADAEDDAFWRRILVLPFTHQLAPEEADPNVKETLLKDPAARSAILAWAVQGTIRWLAAGRRLIPPSKVKEAVQDYRGDCDDISAFFDDCLAFGPDLSIETTELNKTLSAWCQDNGVRLPWANALASRLEKKGCERARKHGGSKRIWLHVGVREPSMFSDEV